MNGRLRNVLIVIALALITSLLLVFLLPRLVAALPSQVRLRLPEEVLRAITTPLPTALPPPISASAGTPVPVAQLLLSTSTPTATPTAMATPTLRPTADAARQTAENVIISPTPMPRPSPTAVPSPTRAPADTLITGLTIVPQKFNNCGPANLSVLLDYYGAADTQVDIAARIKPHYDDRNVTPEELASYVNEQTGLAAAVFRGGDVDLLQRLLMAGFPVIVEKGYEPNEWQGWMGHYLTLIGFDDSEETFTGLDTFLGPWDSSGRAVPYDEVVRQWSHFNYAFLVVYPPQAAGELMTLLGEEILDPQAMWQEAATRAETAVAQEPDNGFAWFNLGASLTHLGDLRADPALYQAAAAAFDQARLAGLPPRMLWYQFEPYRAYIESGRLDEALALGTAVMQGEGGWHVEETHYYQALAYLAQDRRDQARIALQRALEIRSNYPEAIQLLETIDAS